MLRATHPVWAVYDKLRTARLNVKYYERRLETIERQNLVIEFVLLVSAPTSAIAGLWFWDTPQGAVAWKVFSVVAALAAVIKPLLALTKCIKDFENALSVYRTLEYDLMEIKALIEQKQRYDSQLQAEFRKAVQRKNSLVGKVPETREKKKVKKVCEQEVLQELPSVLFFVPEV